MVRSRAVVVALVAFAAACTEARAPHAPSRRAMPACPRGSFSGELDALLPRLSPLEMVPLVAVETLDRSIEPGCVVPFRREPDERLLDVGRVVVKSLSRSEKGKPELLGRGRLEIGRRALRLRLSNDAGDESLALNVDGRHVSLRQKSGAPFEGDVSPGEDTELPFPFDALVAALDSCDADERLGRTEDGNIVEARRGELALWRSRWMDAGANAVVDTSFACAKADARFMWRTAVGDCLPMLAAASARSDRMLVIVRQGPSETEDITDYGFGGIR